MSLLLHVDIFDVFQFFSFISISPPLLALFSFAFFITFIISPLMMPFTLFIYFRCRQIR